MAYDIGPKIGVEGEAKFKQQLKRVNDELKTLGTEMKKVTSEFIGSEDSMEAYGEKTKVLNKQIDAQEEKLKLLKTQLEKTTEAYGEGDSRTQNYQRQVNNTTADLNKLRAELKKAEEAMEDLGDETKDASEELGDLSGGFGGVKSIFSGSGGLGGLLTKGFAVGAVVGGIKEISGAIFDLVDSTQEYRTVMASLDASSKLAGYSAEETAETYAQLQGVLGDSQAAATTTANLQALGLSQEQLTELTNGAIGAWAKYGDSIPIDGLAEAINETVKTSTVTGNLADVLSWAGVNEDQFNEKLAAANSESERANIVMQELARQGLTEAGQAWIETNQDIVQANRSTDEMDAAMARLGGKFAPLAAGARSFGATVINGMIDAGEKFVAWAVELPGKMKKVGQDLLSGLWNGISDKINWLKKQVGGVVDKIKSWFTGSDGFDTHSPSKWSEKVFANVMEGGAIGVNRGTVGLMRSVNEAVSAVKRDLSHVNTAPIQVQTAGTGGQYGGVRPEELAAAMRKALHGAAVYMDRKKVGQLVTDYQNNGARSWSMDPVYG